MEKLFKLMLKGEPVMLNPEKLPTNIEADLHTAEWQITAVKNNKKVDIQSGDTEITVKVEQIKI